MNDCFIILITESYDAIKGLYMSATKLNGLLLIKLYEMNVVIHVMDFARMHVNKSIKT